MPNYSNRTDLSIWCLCITARWKSKGNGRGVDGKVAGESEADQGQGYGRDAAMPSGALAVACHWDQSGSTILVLQRGPRLGLVVQALRQFLACMLPQYKLIRPPFVDPYADQAPSNTCLVDASKGWQTRDPALDPRSMIP